METKRLILFVVFSFSLLLLWDSWQQNQIQSELAQNNETLDQDQGDVFESFDGVDTNTSYALESDTTIIVNTPLYKVSIDTVGGDIRNLKLINFQNDDQTDFYNLLSDENNPLLYIAQSGLIGDSLPTHKDIYTTDKLTYDLEGSNLEVPLSFENSDVKITKIYGFSPDKYQISLTTKIENKSDTTIKPQVYYQLLHDHNSGATSGIMPTFTGVSYYSEDSKFKKIDFDDIRNDKPFTVNSADGWIGIIERYFASAWIITGNSPRQFYTKRLNDNVSSAGVRAKLAEVPSNSNVTVNAILYTGPQ